MPAQNDGWTEYSQYVLKELERLAAALEKVYVVLRESESGLQSIRVDIERLRSEIATGKLQLDLKAKVIVAVIACISGIGAALIARLM